MKCLDWLSLFVYMFNRSINLYSYTVIPLFCLQELDDVKGSYPLLVLQFPNRQIQIPLLTTAAQKRNAELLNTLLGSQELRNMHNAGRR